MILVFYFCRFLLVFVLFSSIPSVTKAEGGLNFGANPPLHMRKMDQCKAASVYTNNREKKEVSIINLKIQKKSEKVK